MESKPRSRSLLHAFLAAALLASAWAAFGPECASCGGPAELFGGKKLALLGTIFYGALLALALTRRAGTALFAGIQIACGVHGALLAVLLETRTFCAPCALAGAAAFAALAVAIRLDPAGALRTSLALPAAAVAVQAWAHFAANLPEAQAVAEKAVERELAAPAPPAGTVRMIAFVRPDCGYCRVLERDVLPPLAEEFRGRLSVEERSAEHLPGVPTPTIILSGPAGRRVFPGLPPEEDLREAILEALGENRR